MMILLLGFGISSLLTLLVVRSAHRHARFSADHDLTGPQKFHVRSVPRIGGVGVFAAVLCALLAIGLLAPPSLESASLLAVCALPAFLAGLLEDVTKRVTPRMRLIATAISALLAVWLLDAVLVRTDLPGLDWIVSFPFGAAVVTVFVVTGVANSVNIIDGFNGLSSMCVAMMLAAIAYVAFQVGDSFVMLCALGTMGAVLGFFVWNYPRGHIFLGDGGAYFLGFVLAELAILLVGRNPDVSPLFALQVCIYPVFETVFSMYRRRVLKDVAAGQPDGLHLHSLIYRRIIGKGAADSDEREMTHRNSMTSRPLWMLCALSLLPSILWWRSTLMIGVCILLFAYFYVLVYWRIVRFRAPTWMVGPGRDYKRPARSRMGRAR